MNEREWIDSTERALEVVEGQLALARSVSATAVQVEIETLQKVYDAAVEQPKESE